MQWTSACPSLHKNVIFLNPSTSTHMQAHARTHTYICTYTNTHTHTHAHTHGNVDTDMKCWLRVSSSHVPHGYCCLWTDPMLPFWKLQRPCFPGESSCNCRCPTSDDHLGGRPFYLVGCNRYCIPWGIDEGFPPRDSESGASGGSLLLDRLDAWGLCVGSECCDPVGSLSSSVGPRCFKSSSRRGAARCSISHSCIQPPALHQICQCLGRGAVSVHPRVTAPVVCEHVCSLGWMAWLDIQVLMIEARKLSQAIGHHPNLECTEVGVLLDGLGC